MVLVNVKFNWFWIIYIQIFENNNVIGEIFDILNFNSVNWNCSRVFGIQNLSLRYTGEINVEHIKVKKIV